jgi:acyl-CoA reductase-like NAD-dependent aldehyde dehydrogenase
VAARAAQAKWWSQSAYNRGQVIYRLAEMAESRRDELAEHVGLAEGLKPKPAQQSVARSIDRMVWYAGWTDKIAQILGSSNPVAGPFFNFSVPVPSGVVAVSACRSPRSKASSTPSWRRSAWATPSSPSPVNNARRQPCCSAK